MMQQQQEQRQRLRRRPYDYQRAGSSQGAGGKRFMSGRNGECGSGRTSGRGLKERNHFARRDLHEVALRELSRIGPSDYWDPQQTTSPSPLHNDTAQQDRCCCCLPSAAFVMVAAAAANRRQQQTTRPRHGGAYSPQGFIEQLMEWPGSQRQAAVADRPTTDRITSGLASSSLARELIQHIRPTQPVAAVLTTTTRSTGSQDAMQALRSKSNIHKWHWVQGESDNTNERLLSDDKLEVCFHPECAESTAAIRGSQPFKQNGNYYYWEVMIYDKIFGTSMMLGLCTEDQSMHRSDYCNLVGLDKEGWSLSHKGLIWHDGKYSKYTNDFTINQNLTVGLLFDTMRGELSYFINGENLGVAFSRLNNCNKDLYPVVGSTAKRTRMRLVGSYCGYASLSERACYAILKRMKNEADLVQTLEDNRIPKHLIDHMADIAEVCRGQTEKSAKNAQCVDL